MLQIWECGWEGCDYQYEEQEDLFQHVTSTSGHLQGQRKYSLVNVLYEQNV